MLVAALFALSLAAQAEAPPPPTLETPGEAAPETTTPSTPPPPAAVPAPDAKVAPPGMSPGLTLGVQFCAGCLTAAVVGPIVGWIPVLGSLVILPGAVALVETFVGDYLGQQRGAILWPWIGAALSSAIGSVVFIGGGIALAYIIGAAAFIAAAAAVGSNPALVIPIVLAAGAGFVIPILVGVVLYLTANALTPALVYMFTAEDKRPGDTGGGFPGFISPNHPGGAAPGSKQVSARTRARLVPAMAY